jgi:hypothetical protein
MSIKNAKAKGTRNEHRSIQLPAHDGRTSCPNCGAILRIEWHAERLLFARGGER